VNFEFLHIDRAGSRADGNDGGEGALGDNGNTGALGVLLGELSELLGNLSDILGTPVVALRVGDGLSLVTECVVSVGKNTVQLLLEELSNERRGKRQHEGLVDKHIRMKLNTLHEKHITYLVLRRGLLTKSDDGGNADSQVVSTNVVELGLLNQRPDFGLLEVLNLVLVGSSKVGTHAAIVASDDNTTLAGRLGFINTVLGVDTGLLTGLLEDVTVLVLANAANVDNGLLGKHVLKNR
jgi:hypothetical protein